MLVYKKKSVCPALTPTKTSYKEESKIFFIKCYCSLIRTQKSSFGTVGGEN
jgi:hypothetical protein